MGLDYLGHCVLGIAVAALLAALTGLGAQSDGECLQALGVGLVLGVVGLGLIALHRRRRT
jgi:MYXO-CTERM domain-containing protein